MFVWVTRARAYILAQARWGTALNTLCKDRVGVVGRLNAFFSLPEAPIWCMRVRLVNPRVA